MKKLINNLLKMCMVAEVCVILLTIYCFIGDIPFRSMRLLWADLYMLGSIWIIYEILNPIHINNDKETM